MKLKDGCFIEDRWLACSCHLPLPASLFLSFHWRSIINCSFFCVRKCVYKRTHKARKNIKRLWVVCSHFELHETKLLLLSSAFFAFSDAWLYLPWGAKKEFVVEFVVWELLWDTTSDALVRKMVLESLLRWPQKFVKSWTWLRCAIAVAF